MALEQPALPGFLPKTVTPALRQTEWGSEIVGSTERVSVRQSHFPGAQESAMNTLRPGILCVNPVKAIDAC
jgi:hypothetical protein